MVASGAQNRASATDQLTAVVLAAGLSRRMGPDVNKLLLVVDGEPLVRRSVGAVLGVSWAEVVVVLGFEAERVGDALAGLPVRTVYHPDFAAGQATSIRAGLRALARPASGVAICLSDQVGMTADDYALLQRAWRDRPAGEALVPHFEGQRGNPVILSDSAVRTIEARGGRFACRRFTETHADLVYRHEHPNPHVLQDLDVPADDHGLVR